MEDALGQNGKKRSPGSYGREAEARGHPGTGHDEGPGGLSPHLAIYLLPCCPIMGRGSPLGEGRPADPTASYISICDIVIFIGCEYVSHLASALLASKPRGTPRNRWAQPRGGANPRGRQKGGRRKVQQPLWLGLTQPIVRRRVLRFNSHHLAPRGSAAIAASARRKQAAQSA